jgi:endonuclease/exonuclease/phosphatase family metal-dependent hydrolase
VLRPWNPDIVALQEVDVGRKRTGHQDQALAIASALGMQFHFHPALRVIEELYGDAILSRHPSHLVKAGGLPTLAGKARRGALWACIDVHGHHLHVVNTHLGLGGLERRLQADTLMGPDWLGRPGSHPLLILTGDFNSVPQSGSYRRLVATLTDARKATKDIAGATYPSRLPVLTLDHMFVGTAVNVLGMRTINTPLTRLASDHLPLMMEFSLESRAQVAA